MKKEGRLRYLTFVEGFKATIGALTSLIFFLVVTFVVVTLFVPAEEITGGNVAVVPIKGTLSSDKSSDLLEKDSTSADTIIDWIKDANKNAQTKAIILDIDSPGGSPVATDEIARAVKESNKTVVAVIREAGASGAFWVATAADYIFANRMSTTGSIGVVGSYLEFAGLLQNYNVTYRRLIAGQYKDAGSRWKEMTPEEQNLYQKLLNQVHADFVQEVAANRKLPIEKVKEIAHGFVLTGQEAKELGLVDALGNKDDAVTYIEQRLNITAKLYEFTPAKTFFEELIGVSSYHLGQGIGTALTQQSVSNDVKITT